MTDDGGPAFPTIHGTYLPETGVIRFADYGLCDSGMSLRDWFAGMALANVNTDICDTAESWADAAYCLADAMLAERTKGETT